MRDILESGLTANDKAYALTHIQGNTRDYFKRHHTNIAFEPVAIAMRGRYTKDGEIEQHFEARSDMKGNALTTATKNSSEINDKSPSLTTGSMVTSSCATTIFTQTDKKNIGINKPFYKVENGYITVNEEQYPIKLADGYYIIRPLTVTECCRLQTLPDDYCRAVSKTQAYKGLGNGWTQVRNDNFELRGSEK